VLPPLRVKEAMMKSSSDREAEISAAPDDGGAKESNFSGSS
jgi:hypothetical protein